MTTTTDYIQQLVLADDGPTRHRMTVTRGLGAGEVEAPVLPASPLPAGLQAAVDAGTLLSFVDGIGRQERDDVLHAVQLAHRGASGRFDRGTQVAEWYRLYTEILEQVGWTAERLAFAEYRQDEGDLRLDKAALKVIAAVATQNQLSLLTDALDVLQAMADGDRVIEVFNLHTSSSAGGNFQIGAVQRSDSGTLAMALGAFHFTTPPPGAVHRVGRQAPALLDGGAEDDAQHRAVCAAPRGDPSTGIWHGCTWGHMAAGR